MSIILNRYFQDFSADDYNRSWFVAAIFSGLLLLALPFNAVVIAIISAVALMGITLLSPTATFSLLIIVMPLRTLIMTEAPSLLSFDFSPILILLPLASIMIARIQRGYNLLSGDLRVPLIIGTYVLAAMLSGLSATSMSDWIIEILKWLILLIVAYFVSGLPTQAKEWLIAALCMGAVANAVVGIYIFLGGSGALHLLINDRFFRAFGTFGQPNPFGGFMGLVAPFAIAMTLGCGQLTLSAKHNKRINLRISLTYTILYGISSCIIILGLLISWSRGAWMALVVSIFVVVFSIPRKWWQRFGLVGIIFVLFFAIWSTGRVPSSIDSRINSAISEFFNLSDVRAVDITSENYPIIERLAHWQAAVNMFESHFWIGVGAGNYEASYDNFRLMNWHEPLGHAHNYYLNVLGEAGIIGLISYLFMLVMVFIIAWQTLRHPDMLSRMMAVGFIGSWAYLAVHSLTDNLYVNNLYLHIGLMLGILGQLNNEVRKMRTFKYE